MSLLHFNLLKYATLIFGSVNSILSSVSGYFLPNLGFSSLELISISRFVLCVRCGGCSVVFGRTIVALEHDLIGRVGRLG